MILMGKTNEMYPWQAELWQRWMELRRRSPHAILLKGPPGIGKLDFSMHIARSLLCNNSRHDGSACQECASCHWFEQGTHPDFSLLLPSALSAEIQEASETRVAPSVKNWTRGVADEALEEQQKKGKKPGKEISVQQIRSISGLATLSSHQGGQRVVLIYPAESMNLNAANALLKTLEEPPGRMMMILVSHRAQQLLPTIVSRCLTLVAATPEPEVSASWLRQQAYENPGAILARAGFSPLLAVRLAERDAGAEEYRIFLQEIRQPCRLDVFSLAEKLQRIEPVHVIHWLQQWCYDLGSAKLTGEVRYHTDIKEHLINLSSKVGMFDLLTFQGRLITARREALHPLNPKLLFESILMSYRGMMLGASTGPAG